MQQLTLWDERPKKRAAKVPIFRTIIQTKLYSSPRGKLVEQWTDTVDFILFTSDGQITDDELSATHTITRQQGIRITYSVWRNHCYEPYDRELMFTIDAGHAWQSIDAKEWKTFTKTQARIKVVKTRTDRFALQP